LRCSTSCAQSIEAILQLCPAALRRVLVASVALIPERETRWFDVPAAGALVDEGELAEIIRLAFAHNSTVRNLLARA
jgi:hypothetical protein